MILVFLNPVFVSCRCTQIGNNDHTILIYRNCILTLYNIISYLNILFYECQTCTLICVITYVMVRSHPLTTYKQISFVHVWYIDWWCLRGVTETYVVLPKISENLLIITWILTLSPNFHRHLQSSHLGLVYDPSDFAIFGSSHWSLPALACLVPVAILLGSLQWIRNTALSTRVSF